MGLCYSKKNKIRRSTGMMDREKKAYDCAVPQNNSFMESNTNTECSREMKEEAPWVSEKQKELMFDSWKTVEAEITKVGVIMFMKLFETHPDVQDVFEPFKGKTMEDLKYSNQLRSHALRVMGTVEKCLARINEPKKLQAMLHDLGSRHVMYSAKVDYIDLIGPQFIWAIQPVLGDRWTPELEQAWSDLFKFISHIMKEAMTF